MTNGTASTPAGPRLTVRILHVPGCPNTAALVARLAGLIAGPAHIEQQVVCDQDQAAAVGMRGSPTLLINNVDPFAVAGQTPSLSCRIYRDNRGRPCGAPTVAQLHQALARLGGDG